MTKDATPTPTPIKANKTKTNAPKKGAKTNTNTPTTPDAVRIVPSNSRTPLDSRFISPAAFAHSIHNKNKNKRKTNRTTPTTPTPNPNRIVPSATTTPFDADFISPSASSATSSPHSTPKKDGAGGTSVDLSDGVERILQGTSQSATPEKRNCREGGSFGSCERTGELCDECKAVMSQDTDPDSNAHVLCTRNSNNGYASVCACEQCEELRNSFGASSRFSSGASSLFSSVTSSLNVSPVRSNHSSLNVSPVLRHNSSVTPSLNWSPEFPHFSFSTKKLTRTDTVYSTGSAGSEDSTNTEYSTGSTGSVWGHTLPHRSDSNESNRSDRFDVYGFRYNQDDDEPYYRNPDSDFSSDA